MSGPADVLDVPDVRGVLDVPDVPEVPDRAPLSSVEAVADEPAFGEPDEPEGIVAVAASPDDSDLVVVRIWSMISAFLLRALAFRPSALAIASS